MKALTMLLSLVLLIGCQSTNSAPNDIENPGLSATKPTTQATNEPHFVVGNSLVSMSWNLGGQQCIYSERNGYMRTLNSEWVDQIGNVERVTLDYQSGTYHVTGNRANAVIQVTPRGTSISAALTGRDNEVKSLVIGESTNEPDRKQAWNDFWETDILLKGPEEDQEALKRHLYTLRLFGPTPGGPVPGVFSTGSMKYRDAMFWDHDVWIFPALMLLDPEAAKSIPEVRLKQVSQAAINAKDLGDVGLKFPWETDESGKELTQGNNVKQIHINGDVALGLRWAAWLGLVPDEKVVEIEKGVGEYYANRLKVRSFRNMGVWYGFDGIFGPDEFHLVNDDLYTSVIAQNPINLLDWGMDYYWPHVPREGIGPAFEEDGDPINMLAYAGDPLQNYQQASAILTAWPAQNPYFEKIAVPMVRRFGPHVTENGPAMTKSVEALLLARFGDANEAHGKWRESFETYEKGPLKLFCENPKSTDGPFLTGIAGCLNAVIYGFAGVRLDDKPWPDANWKKQLKSGAWVSIRPNLPSAWKKLTLTRIWLDGVAYRVEIVGKSVTVRELPASAE